jgi:hypothetical protein
MEDDQRVIIEIFWNERADAGTLQTNFRHSLMNMLINFE